MADNIAEEMLRILPTSRAWTTGTFRSGPRKCLIGARLHIIQGSPELASNFDSPSLRKLDRDPYIRLLARIIEEQYPDRVATLKHTPTQAIIGFNDYYATTYKDVRLVLEKTAAAWEEEHG